MLEHGEVLDNREILYSTHGYIFLMSLKYNADCRAWRKEKTMKEYVKNIIKHTPIYSLLKKLRNAKIIMEWKRKGCPVPPPHLIKQRALQKYAKMYGLNIMVETGTYNGDMVNAMRDVFDNIYSIELSNELYENAEKRFSEQTHIHILHGDSGSEIEKLVSKIDRPALFWLDAHYSGGVTARGKEDTPILTELHHIFNASDKGHIVVIDDARVFGVDPAYPTIKELTDFIESKKDNMDIVVKDDIIRVTPRQ